MGQKLKKGEDSMSNRTRQTNKRADRQMESNDSPVIPDRGETSEEPGLHSGLLTCNVLDNSNFKLLHSNLALWMPYMPMLILMNLTRSQ